MVVESQDKPKVKLGNGIFHDQNALPLVQKLFLLISIPFTCTVENQRHAKMRNHGASMKCISATFPSTPIPAFRIGANIWEWLKRAPKLRKARKAASITWKSWGSRTFISCQ